jgi:RNA polymerase sigma-70 factor (ECF subfamily)
VIESSEEKIAPAGDLQGSEPLLFDAFYEASYGRMVTLAFGLTRRVAVAEELAQEAFLEAFRNWDRVRAYDDPLAWVRRVVTHRCVSAWRRGLTETRLMARLQREPTVPLTLPDPEERVWRAIGQLSTRQRQCVALVLLDGCTAPEAASLLDISEDSVRTHVERAKKKLFTMLDESEVGK